jgi:nicotinamidase/pyrazinamidase
MKTLLLIGMQTDLLPGGAIEVPGSAALIPIVNRLLPFFDQVIAANFSLPANHLSFAASHPWRKPGQMVLVEGHPTPLQTMYCVKGSFGAEFAPGLQREKVSAIFEMGNEEDAVPHSAFFDGGNPKSTGLREHLRHENIAEIYIAGMPLELQVANTASDALALNIQPVLIKDACFGQAISKSEEHFLALSLKGVCLITSEELTI